MSNDFDDIKKIWLTVATNQDAEFKNLEKSIHLLRKNRKQNIYYWSISMILFSLMIFVYVVYTDKLDSIYESISEFILLFIGMFLFWYSWKSINRQKKEFLLSSSDFVKDLQKKESVRMKKQLQLICVSASFLCLSMFFQFLSNFLQSQTVFILASLSLLLIILLVWFFFKPLFYKNWMNKNEKKYQHLYKILNNINAIKL
ncbi:MAG TPA: hypothetical protein PK191_05565 [Niabella sp.]|nr:hypothetical protein [Niabella sp.]HOZ95974.1 hypothetical protein [Niabella sp.]HQW15531.1 hypothetical protein [Niabella sp.]HQX20674.1 hypothetical protein [Niabella sp.]HQX40549.1 hypothetical protein [Niabella sp.]